MNWFKGIDWFIFLAVLVLAGLSLAIISSVAPNLFLSQAIFFVICFVLMILFAQIEIDIFAPFLWFIYFFVCAGLLLTDIIGAATRGSVRWIEIMGFGLQISEIGKPLLLLFFANYLARNPLYKLRNFLKFGFLFFIPVFLILRQPDLGSALVYGLAFIAMAFFAGLSWIHIITINFAGLIFAPILWQFLHDYQKARILSFLNPNTDPQGASYNAIQATIAAGSGMLFGKGLGRGTQSQLLFLPEKHTDFVFASLTEELGFLSGGAVIVLQMIIIWRILRLLNKVNGEKLYFLVGVVAIVFGQVFINIGMNIGVMPVTGITLPFVSYGGSSLIALGIMLGLVQSIAKSTVNRYNTEYEMGSYSDFGAAISGKSRR